MRKFYLFAFLLFTFLFVKSQTNASFEEIQLNPGTYWNGSDEKGGFKSGNIWFPNAYIRQWGSWSGFSVSNMKDTLTGNWSNQYSAITGKGVKNSVNYAVVYLSEGLKIEFDDPKVLTGFYVTNSTYAALTMKNGDSFSKKFGGRDGKDPDFFKLVITGTDIYGKESIPEEIFLADFRADDSSKDYILRDWKWVDLGKIGIIRNLKFKLESSDTGAWGMNTPSYFCMDEFNGYNPESMFATTEAGFDELQLKANSFYNGSDGAKKITSGGYTFKNSYNAEWASWSGFAASNLTDTKTKGWANQYSAIAGSGALGTSVYAVSYAGDDAEIEFQNSPVTGFYITNSTYAYWSMKEGDSFSKKFGGNSANDPDWFKVTISGYDKNGKISGSKDFYLADFRSSKNGEDYILSDWKWVDLSTFGMISKIKFTLSSSDVGAWGMNTPSYFCIDQLNHQDLPPYVKNPVATVTEYNILKNSFAIPIEPIFTDPDNPDSEMEYNIELNNNNTLVAAKIVYLENNENQIKPCLSCEVASERTGISNITISVTSNHKKAFHTISIIVSVPVGIIETEIAEFRVYPNPFKENLTVNIPVNSQSLTLFSPTGQIVYTKKLTNENQFQLKALNNLPSGVYVLTLKTASGIKSLKVFKQ